MQESRFQIVERALLERLLEELKLGSSNLTDPATALSLGKIMAARILVNADIFYFGPEIQISIRLIETETSRVVGALNETFHRPVTDSEMVERLADIIKQKLESVYPLKGRITGVSGKDVTINIGQRQGVKPGLRFKVLGTECELEVVSVEENDSTARIERGPVSEVKNGLKIRII